MNVKSVQFQGKTVLNIGFPDGATIDEILSDTRVSGPLGYNSIGSLRVAANDEFDAGLEDEPPNNVVIFLQSVSTAGYPSSSYASSSYARKVIGVDGGVETLENESAEETKFRLERIKHGTQAVYPSASRFETDAEVIERLRLRKNDPAYPTSSAYPSSSYYPSGSAV